MKHLIHLVVIVIFGVSVYTFGAQMFIWSVIKPSLLCCISPGLFFRKHRTPPPLAHLSSGPPSSSRVIISLKTENNQMILLAGTRGLVRSLKDHPGSLGKHTAGTGPRIFSHMGACTLGPSVAPGIYTLIRMALPHVHAQATRASALQNPQPHICRPRLNI